MELNIRDMEMFCQFLEMYITFSKKKNVALHTTETW